MDYRIKDLPENERPREKLSKKGVSSLSKVELLSLVIRTGIQGKNVKEISAHILKEYSISELADTPTEKLEEIEGISKVKAGQLVAVGELGRRFQKDEKKTVSSLSDVVDMIQDMRFKKEEELRAFHLSSGNKILAKQSFQGGVDSAQLESRKILRQALNKGATALIIAHNHPSGRSEPTEQDIRATRELEKLLDELELDLLDHVIIGDGLASMKKKGLLNQQQK